MALGVSGGANWKPWPMCSPSLSMTYVPTWDTDGQGAASHLTAPPPPPDPTGQLAALRRARAEMAAVAFRARRALAQIDADIAALGGTTTDEEPS